MNIVAFDEAAERLQRGEIGVIPTDTVYGVVACAASQSATKRLYELKKREHKPGTLIAANIGQLIDLGVSESEINKVKQWWPNPVSAILAVQGHEYLHQGVGSLAMRVVADAQVRELLEQTGPLITSSANQPGQPPATTIQEALDYFGDTVDFYADGGTISDKQPSTIIRPTDQGIEVLRQGSVSL